MMEEQDFLDALQTAADAHPKAGNKWDDLEQLYSDNGLRGNGALNNGAGADRTTRARQLATSKTHRGHTSRGVASHSVFAVGGDLDAYDSDPSGYLDFVKESVEKEHPTFESCLVVVIRPGQAPEPVKLFKRTADPLPVPYEEWWPDLDVEVCPRITDSETDGGDQAGAEQGLSVNWDELSVPVDPCGLVGLKDACVRVISALKAGKHVILTGPPGTGKTHLARSVCRLLAVASDVVSATSDWTTFETVGGYLPDPSQQDGGQALNFFPGVVLQAIDRQRWLVIDELNRADIDKAFGELFTLLSGGDVKLPFKHRESGQLRDVALVQHHTEVDSATVRAFRMPKDWRLIGTMNTFDKASLFQLSFAFMRRFAFVEIAIPSQDDYQSLLERSAVVLTEDDEDGYGDGCLGMLKNVFAPASSTGLDALGLRVGPAIALDVIEFLAQRRTLSAEDEPPDPKQCVLDSVEMYLLPQFEGQDKKHKKIVAAIGDALELAEDDRTRLDRRLRTWTGFEPRKSAP